MNISQNVNSGQTWKKICCKKIELQNRIITSKKNDVNNLTKNTIHIFIRIWICENEIIIFVIIIVFIMRLHYSPQVFAFNHLRKIFYLKLKALLQCLFKSDTDFISLLFYFPLRNTISKYYIQIINTIFFENLYELSFLSQQLHVQS